MVCIMTYRKEHPRERRKVYWAGRSSLSMLLWLLLLLGVLLCLVVLFLLLLLLGVL
jgi:hypothetical protein